MAKENQIQFHKSRWDAALNAVEAEKNRLIAEKGEAVIGPQNPTLVKLVLAEMECEEKYRKVLNS